MNIKMPDPFGNIPDPMEEFRAKMLGAVQPDFPGISEALRVPFTPMQEAIAAMGVDQASTLSEGLWNSLNFSRHFDFKQIHSPVIEMIKDQYGLGVASSSASVLFGDSFTEFMSGMTAWNKQAFDISMFEAAQAASNAALRQTLDKIWENLDSVAKIVEEDTAEELDDQAEKIAETLLVQDMAMRANIASKIDGAINYLMFTMHEQNLYKFLSSEDNRTLVIGIATASIAPIVTAMFPLVTPGVIIAVCTWVVASFVKRIHKEVCDDTPVEN